MFTHFIHSPMAFLIKK